MATGRRGRAAAAPGWRGSARLAESASITPASSFRRASRGCAPPRRGRCRRRRPAPRVDRLRHLVHVADGRDAGADVEELLDADREQRPYGPAQEGPAGAHRVGHVGRHAGDLLGELAVDSRSCAPRRGSSRRPGRALGGPGRSPRGTPPAVASSAPVRQPAPPVMWSAHSRSPPSPATERRLDHTLLRVIAGDQGVERVARQRHARVTP